MHIVATLAACVIYCSICVTPVGGIQSDVAVTDHHQQKRQQKRKLHRENDLRRSSAEPLFSNNALPVQSNTSRWLLLAANPRLVSFFGNPRFQHFSSGRHVINIASMQFKNLFPKSTKRESIVGGDGKLHLVLVSTLLATLVPQTSQNFAVMKKKAAHHSAPFADLWRATHDPSSVNMVGMMEILQACSYS